MNQYRCDNKCNLFEDKPGQLQPPKEQEGDWIGWCHLRSGNLLVLRSTYDLICYFGCASHSDFQSGWDTVLDIGGILESLCKTDLYWYNKGVTEGEDVGKCRGKDCNYCGRYNEKLRQAGR